MRDVSPRGVSFLTLSPLLERGEILNGDAPALSGSLCVEGGH
jgi:hypothetical protein